MVFDSAKVLGQSFVRLYELQTAYTNITNAAMKHFYPRGDSLYPYGRQQNVKEFQFNRI